MSNLNETNIECKNGNSSIKSEPSQRKVPPRRSSRILSTIPVVNTVPNYSQKASTSAEEDLTSQEVLICEKRKAILNKVKRSHNVSKVLPRTCNSHSFEATWEERDRQRLLVALQRHGVLNLKELQKAVPGKTEEQIKAFIQTKWRAARMYLREELKKKKKKDPCLGPIDKWLECLNESFPCLDVYKTNPLARAVLFIWKFENHPDPKECGGVDFKAAYEYLYYMLRGYPPRELNQPTAAFISETLSTFAVNLKQQPWNEEKSFIKNTPLSLKCPARETKTDEDVISALSFTEKESLAELLKLPGFNPFDIPLRFLDLTGPDSMNADSSSPTSSNTMTHGVDNENGNNESDSNRGDGDDVDKGD